MGDWALHIYLNLTTVNWRLIVKKTLLQFAGIAGMIAVLISTLNVDALAYRRHHHHYRHYYISRHHHHHHHGDRW